MKNKLILIAAIMGASAAQAQWAVYDNRVETAVKALMDAVRGGAQATNATQAEAVNQNSQVAAEVSRSQEEAKAKKDFRIADACSAISGTAGLSDSQRETEDQNRGGKPPPGSPPATPPGLSEDSPLMKELRKAGGRILPESFELQAARAAAGMCDAFVDPTSVRGIMCKRAGNAPKVRWGLKPDADISVSTLLDGKIKATDVTKKFTIVRDEADPGWTAVQALRRHFSVPIELPALTEAQAKSDAGRQYLSFKDSYEARMGLADRPMASVVAQRAATPATLPAVNQLLNSDVTRYYIEEYLKKNAPSDWKTRGISLDELTNLEVERRHMNIDWHRNIASQPGDPLMKELLAMKAFDQWQAWQARQQLSEIQVLLGQLIGASVRAEMTPTLNGLHGRALTGMSSGRR
jgi:hypothetical protein